MSEYAIIAAVPFLPLHHHDGRMVRGGGLFVFARRSGRARPILHMELAEAINRRAVRGIPVGMGAGQRHERAAGMLSGRAHEGFYGEAGRSGIGCYLLAVTWPCAYEPCFGGFGGVDNAPNDKHQSIEREFWKSQLEEARKLRWITAASAILSLCALLGLMLQLRLEQISTVAADRGWLTISRVDNGAVAAGAPVYTILNVVNTGHEPALRVNWFTKVYSVAYIAPDAPFPFLGKNATCDKLPLSSRSNGFAVFPGDTLSAKIPLLTRKEEQPAVDGLVASKRPLILDGCMVYEAGEDRRETGFRFILRDPKPSEAESSKFFRAPDGNFAN